jgi:hypothetical protein
MVERARQKREGFSGLIEKVVESARQVAEGTVENDANCEWKRRRNS